MPAKKVAFSEEMGSYFSSLMAENQKCYAIAEEARSKGMDPETRVEIPQAEDLASRVEKLLADYNVGEVADDIRRLTAELGNRELVSLEIAKLVAQRPAEKKELAVDRAIRVGLAVLTEGILVAPLEGVADTKIKTNSDGSEYIDLMFAGPIRAAGGTAQAMSVLIADVVRQAVGIGKYIPTDQEVDRFIEEIPLYKQCQHLQYTPSSEEIRLIVRECPICIDGEGTERMEISGFRDLPRIETNQVRGGACLVIAEGLCLKAAKIKKHVDKLKIQGWDFMEKYLAGKNVAKGDIIIALGYRVQSDVAVRFRRWATQRLHEYIQKGFVMDDERLKQGRNRYFRELLQRIRDIRSSERNFYQQVTDIYATATDYDPRSKTTLNFFATVQNKLHYAVHEHTAAELIYERVDSEKPFVGMTNFKGDYVTKDDVKIAKNYLSEVELQRLNLLVSEFLDFAEFQALEEKPMKMQDWIKALDNQIVAHQRKILEGKGSISHDQAMRKAEKEYELFRKKQLANLKSDFDLFLKDVKSIEKSEK